MTKAIGSYMLKADRKAVVARRLANPTAGGLGTLAAQDYEALRAKGELKDDK